MTSRFKISSKHDISTLTIHVLICWNKVTLFGQVVPMCVRWPLPAACPSVINFLFSRHLSREDELLLLLVFRY